MERIICNSANGKLTEDEKLKLARLLVKAGYTVRVGKFKPEGKTVYVHYIEYNAKGDDKNAETIQ
ncbi:resolvase [Diplocloster agilis]|uniref:resolvase n=1 Tax=Diplocloster agilis TaxID=2850323 RepID=UPI001EE82D84